MYIYAYMKGTHFFVFAKSISYSVTVGRDAGDGEAVLEE
jgi:hypothetical protein